LTGFARVRAIKVNVVVLFGEQIILRLVEAAAAALVAVEIVVLLMGVVSRFAFHRPMVWTDEFAGIVFLWLAMLGSVIALARGQHMRLTTIANRMPLAWRARAEVLAIGVAGLFLMLVLPPAIDYAQDQSFIETPALGWSGLIRAAALPVGCTLMFFACAARLMRRQLADILVVAIALLVVGLALGAAAPALKLLGNWNLLLFFVLLLGGAVLVGVPIGFGFAISTLAYLALTTSAPLSVVVSRLDEGMSSLILLAVPLFVFLGALIEMTGMAVAMVNFLTALLGHVRGGMSYALLGAMVLVSGISGSKAADMAAVAPVLFPEMKRRGGEEGEMVALLSTAGAMSETIPPSLVLITIGSVTGVSIAALFTGGLLPALVLALALAAVARLRSRKQDLSDRRRAPGREIWRAFCVALPALALPFLIRASVTEGVATATEVSTIGIVYAVVAGLLLYRKFDWSRLYPMLVDTACLSGAILLIIGAANGMAWALTQSGFSSGLAHAMSGTPGGAWGFLAISIVAFAILGSILEGIPAIVLFGPLLFPIARAVGVNEVHYAMVVVLAMGIGLFAPPFGVGYYTACAIGKVSPDAGLRAIWPYFGALILGLMAVAAIPWLSTGFLP
jgi:tripartite ATP-independent transporter DctM subunit